jgi:flagella basal body P-ring formation protein FlgA
MMILRVAIFWVLATSALADSVVPTRTIRAHSIISATDVMLRAGTAPAGFDQIADVVGQEARVILYPGRPIRFEDIGPPAIVDRNQLVRMTFFAHGLEIVTEGRALERGAAGDYLRIMNLSSRATIIGKVQTDGSIHVSP